MSRCRHFKLDCAECHGNAPNWRNVISDTFGEGPPPIAPGHFWRKMDGGQTLRKDERKADRREPPRSPAQPVAWLVRSEDGRFTQGLHLHKPNMADFHESWRLIPLYEQSGTGDTEKNHA